MPSAQPRKLVLSSATSEVLRLTPAIAATLVALVTLVTFLPALDAAFLVLDDPAYVTANPIVQGGFSSESLAWSLSFAVANWHPVSWWSHILDVELFGLDPRGHHLTSVVIHATTSGLLVLALWRLTGALWCSTIASLLFAVHPQRVESVAWVAERKDVLSGFFFVVALWVWARERDRPTRRLVLVGVVLALGLAAKPMLVTLPVILLLLDYWPLGALAAAPASGSGWSPIAWDRLRHAVAEKTPLLVMAAASSLVTLVAQRGAGAVTALDSHPLGLRLASSVVASTEYLRQAVWPVDLAVFYPFEPLDPGRVASSMILLVGLSAIAIAAYRRAPALLVGWCWYLVMLLPVIGIIQVGPQARADRYTYLPSIGIAIAVVWGLAALVRERRRWRVWAAAATAVGVLLLAATTRHHLRSWVDGETLFSRAVEVTGPNGMTLLLLASSQHSVGNLAGAAATLRYTLEVEPRFPHVRERLALALAELGQLEEALALALEAVSVSPESPRAHFAVGVACLRVGQKRPGLFALLRALALDVNDIQAWLVLATVLEDPDGRKHLEGALAAARAQEPQSPVLEVLLRVLESPTRDPLASPEGNATHRQVFSTPGARAGLELVRKILVVEQAPLPVGESDT